MDNPFVTVAGALAPLILIFVLALAIEGVVEYFGEPVPTRYKRYVAAALAILLCLAYDADILALLGYRPALAPWAGPVLTGLIAGRGSNYLNSFWKRIQVIKAPAMPVDAALPADPNL